MKTYRRSDDPLYKPWYQFKMSTENVNSNNWNDYGARGINLYEEWRPYKHGFDAFRDWVYENLGEKPSPDHILGRYDTTRDIEPGNLHWTTRRESANNRITNALYTMDGRTQSLSDWCREYGKKHRTVWSRIHNYGFTFEEAIKR